MRVALVTGGASGLGLATAKRFAADGLGVVVADLDETRARETAVALPGGGHWGLAMDVADEQSVRSGFDAAESRWGAVAVLACFAGISIKDRSGKSVALVDVEVDEWEAIDTPMLTQILGGDNCRDRRRRAAQTDRHARRRRGSGVLSCIGRGRLCHGRHDRRQRRRPDALAPQSSKGAEE